MMNPNATHLLIRYQEIALKGKNRPQFERRLCNNIRRYVSEFYDTEAPITSASGRFVVALTRKDASTVNKIVDRLATLSGVMAVTPCKLVHEPTGENITAAALDWAEHDFASKPNATTFAIRTRRTDKKFPLRSAELDFSIGSTIRAARPHLSVDLKRAEVKIKIEVRQGHALVYSWEKSGVSGLPMDTTQRVVCLLSGGIDSPVAAYEALRRGLTPVFIHFHSKPFTSEATIAKVKRLGGILRRFSPYPMELWLVPLLDIQKAVRDNCNERYRTIHYRRFMMMLAQELAHYRGAKALITGEAIGQVASQTLTNLQAIEEVVDLPVLRPLITSDKDQIIEKAKKIGTYETSIEPHDDSCVLFAPDKPTTQAKISNLKDEMSMLPVYELVFSALDRAEKVLL